MTQSSSLPAVLRERASLQPNDIAFTYIDYDQDQNGVSEDVTWSQLYRRVRNIAHELRLVGSPGDRVVLLAPQGLDYIAAFLGSLEAKRIAVPLSVPQVGAHDERVGSVLRDTSPSVILTTSPVAGGVADYAHYAQSQHDNPAPQVIEVDRLDSGTRKGSRGRADPTPETAYLQYTSGSTREPAGVMVTNRNLSANFEQMYADFFSDCGKVAPPDTTVVSWLPFYHDMGLLLGVCVPILGGLRTVLTSPLAFLARPARWMQLLASHSRTLTAAPNFAFELAVRKTSDEDLAGLDLGNVMGIISGSERVHTATVQRFTERFARFGFQEKAIRPSYGLAEATVYVATRDAGHPLEVVHFEPEKLSAGHAKRRSTDGGTSLVSYGTPQSPAVRIVDPDDNTERPAGEIGEIWVHGENVAAGYWNKPQETDDKFHAKLAAPSDGTPGEPWLRTGDLGFISDGELFIMGRIKDTLIVYGRNHYPEDIEATIQEISGGRVAAISIPDSSTEKLVTIIELNTKGRSEEEATQRCETVKRSVTSELSKVHGLSAADLVLVAPGSIPITTSGKIRRSTCVEQYQQGQFQRR